MTDTGRPALHRVSDGNVGDAVCCVECGRPVPRFSAGYDRLCLKCWDDLLFVYGAGRMPWLTELSDSGRYLPIRGSH